MTEFDDQDMELDAGDWMADDAGVWRYGAMGGIEVACTHAIMPVERLKNIDTGEMKIRLAFRRGTKDRRSWRTILTDFDTVSNAKNIVSLSRIGVSVTSGRRAQALVDYLSDVMDKNYDRIPEKRSISRMGWNDEGFAPYVDDITFDGNENFSRIFNSIRSAGDYQRWLEIVRECRQYSTAARIIIAASFASALVGPVGVLPFFVHLWGMDAGTGKTVGLMLATSVWANPAVGGPYLSTFKSTAVGTEVLAGFLNSLPVVLDELQLARDFRGKINYNVYELASGSGKLRSNKTLGLASTPTWANCFITSGETPLVGENDGAGAYSRVLEIECKADSKVVLDGHKTANALKENYGHAGKLFIEKLGAEGFDGAKRIYESFYEQCLKNNTVEKQAMAAALILTGDYLSTKWIFDDNLMSVEQIGEFLKSKEAVSAAERGYQYMCDWVSQNSNKLTGNTDSGDVYGLIEDGWAYIIRSTFNRAAAEANISAAALLSHLRSRDLIRTRGRSNTVGKRINKILTECVALKMPKDGFEDLSDQTEVPFE